MGLRHLLLLLRLVVVALEREAAFLLVPKLLL